MEAAFINFDNPEEKKAYIEQVQFMTGRHYIIDDFWDEKRTTDLNRYYRVRLELIRETTGHSVGFLHWHFKRKFIPHIKWGEDFKLSTADMSTSQMLKYLEWIEDWENGFYEDPSLEYEKMEYARIIKKPRK